jgi:hypothetical protein
MEYRWATIADAPLLAAMNGHLIQDEGHRNRMTVAELEARMAGWLRGEYQAVLFEEAGQPVGYALYRRDPEYVYLRQFFVRREFRRCGSTPGAEAGCGWRCWLVTSREWRSGGRSGSGTTASPWSWRATEELREFRPNDPLLLGATVGSGSWKSSSAGEILWIPF